MNFIEYNFALFKKDPPEPSKFDKVLGAISDYAQQRNEMENNVLATGNKKAIKEYYKNTSLANKAEKLGKAYKSIHKDILGVSTKDAANRRQKNYNNKWKLRSKYLQDMNKHLVKQLKNKGI